MSKGLALIATAVVLATTSACHSAASRPTASQICSHALKGKRIASAQLTTVGAIRDWRVGPANRPAHNAFGTTSDASQAAWCWTADHDHIWTVYAAAPNGHSVKFGTLQSGSTPTGAPRFP